ncbi:hypothetical protein T492DRAFT_1048181 [Pavlovales sp. CCMP2436]|nr:hypothetical protein T492DRAFT_1048181 [Pavlovales sp. CCMP2436]
MRLARALVTLLVVGVQRACSESFLVYVKTSYSTLAGSSASTQTWNVGQSAQVFYFFGLLKKQMLREVLARMPSRRQVVFLNVSDTRPELKDLAIWQFAYAQHCRAPEYASIRYFLKLDDDTYTVLPRIAGLLNSDALRAHAKIPFVGGTPFWIRSHPALDGRSARYQWAGSPLVQGGKISSQFIAESRTGREPLVYCQGGPGMLVSRPALELYHGFGEPCAKTIADVEAASCLPYRGRAREWLPADGEAGLGLGHGELGSWMHRIACLGTAQLPRKGPMRRRLKSGGDTWGPGRPYDDCFFGYCLERQHSPLLRCQAIAWTPDSSTHPRAGVSQWVFEVKWSKWLRRPDRNTTFPAHLVTAHGLKSLAAMQSVHATLHAANSSDTDDDDGWLAHTHGRIVIIHPDHPGR